MMIEPLQKLEAWHDFYVMTGSGAAALTGLLFVIVSLGPHVVAKSVDTGVRAFISPIAVHFTSALALSALMLAPEIPRLPLGTAVAVARPQSIIPSFNAIARFHIDGARHGRTKSKDRRHRRRIRRTGLHSGVSLGRLRCRCALQP